MDLRGTSTGPAALALAHNHSQLQEIMAVARAAGVQLQLPALVANTFDTFVLAPAASQATTITLISRVAGTQQTTGLTTVEIKDNGADAVAVTYVSGVLTINLANVTDANNTLSIIRNSIEVACAGAISTFITGSNATQMVHGGTNTRTPVAAGGAVGGGLKSSTAGVVASRTFAIATI